MAVDFDGEQISINEAHRFDGYAVQILDTLHWNPLLMLGKALDGIARASLGDAQVAGIGVDTWGVDYGLLDASDRLIGLPYQYRDERNHGTMEESFSVVPKVDQWREAGIQFLPFNTLYQLIGEKRDHPEMLEAARTLLFMPNLLSFWLCGEKVQERSIASTSAFLNPGPGTWSEDLLRSFGLPSRLFGEITEPGQPIAQLRAIESRDRPMVMAVAGHDTASAFAGSPVRRPGTAILSSGTWSILGLELDEPVLSDDALANGFSNEIGWGGGVRFLKNITGFWILQLLRAELAELGEEKDYGALTSLAEQTREQVDRRRLVEAERAPTRREVQALTIIMAALVVMLLVFGRSEYLAAYDTTGGQIFLGLALAAYVGLIIRVQHLARFPRPGRFLSATGSQPAGGLR